jgi:hypothetical protein
MRATYLILRLRVEEENKLYEKRDKSTSVAFKENFIAQVVKFHNKDLKTKLAEKEKSIAKIYSGK